MDGYAAVSAFPTSAVEVPDQPLQPLQGPDAVTLVHEQPEVAGRRLKQYGFADVLLPAQAHPAQPRDRSRRRSARSSAAPRWFPTSCRSATFMIATAEASTRTSPSAPQGSAADAFGNSLPITSIGDFYFSSNGEYYFDGDTSTRWNDPASSSTIRSRKTPAMKSSPRTATQRCAPNRSLPSVPPAACGSRSRAECSDASPSSS